MRISPRLKVVLHDTLMVALAWELAWLARFNFSFPHSFYWDSQLNALPLVLVTQGLIAWRFGLYRGLWRFASLRDLWNIVRSAALGSLCVMVVLFAVTRLEGVPRSLLILYPIFLIMLLGGSRLAYRVWKDGMLNLRGMANGTRVLVVGAGQAGEAIIREMVRDGSYAPVGMVDDRRDLWRTRIHGVPVVGGVDQLPELCVELSVDLIFLAVPSANNEQMQRIVARCEAAQRQFRTLPRLTDMLAGPAGLKAIREVSIDDLLGREKVRLDWATVHSGLGGRTILISGGGGSIGAELCRQVARLGPARLIVFERCEYNLYRVDMDLRREFPRTPLVTVLGDVCDAVAVRHVFDQYRPDVVFHAAAYKHVPVLEFQPREAVRNNVLGTRICAEEAARAGVATFVLISTDKAVEPASILGATKRLAELVCADMNGRYATRFVTVRFGNVLGSAGSVLPLFQEQIRSGGPVTVTHPDVSRYFMTIPEACELILQAAAMGEGGEIFVLDMGKPVRIAYLAEQVIRLSGKVPGRDIEIEYTGLRPGEKLAERLFHTDEALSPTGHPKILLSRQTQMDSARLSHLLGRLVEAADSCDDDAARALLRDAVIDADAVGAVAGDNNVVTLKRKN